MRGLGVFLVLSDVRLSAVFTAEFIIGMAQQTAYLLEYSVRLVS